MRSLAMIPIQPESLHLPLSFKTTFDLRQEDTNTLRKSAEVELVWTINWLHCLQA